jgi:hypothetical protein
MLANYFLSFGSDLWLSPMSPHVRLAREPELTADLVRGRLDAGRWRNQIRVLLPLYFRSTAGYRLPELLEFFNRMSIADLDRLITSLPIQ